MPFTRPTLQQLVDQAAADLQTRLPGAQTQFRRSTLAVLARVHAAGEHGLYAQGEYEARQLSPITAETERLERWASVWGVFRKTTATASGQVTARGVNGSTIAAGLVLQRSDGQRYLTTAEATVGGGVATVAVKAQTAGAAANTPAAVALSFVSPVAGVQSVAVVTGGQIGGGADAESDASLRARLLQRIQEPPMGGSVADYRRWALACAGVTRAFVTPLYLGPGTVGVTFLRDGNYPDIIPSAVDIAAVQAYLDARRPVCAQVTVYALTAQPLNFQIVLVPDTATVRAAVLANLQDLILHESEPDTPLLISRIREAVSLAIGENDHRIVSPTDNVTPGAGKLITMGAVTWL